MDRFMLERADAARTYVEYEVLAYVANHPGGCDTLEGITTWWLYRQRITDGATMVSEAVKILVAEGQLVALDHRGGETLYAASSDAVPRQSRKLPDEE
jgi:hypothetical protein